jgi:hypothetical protein
MNQIPFALAIAVALSSCANQPCELCGRWRSSAERTLPDMERSSLLSEKQRQFFRNDFYGKLVVETRQNDSRAYFPDESPESVAWEPWELVSRSGNTLTVRYSADGDSVVRDIKLHGDCYQVLQPNLGFGEWFCKEP